MSLMNFKNIEAWFGALSLPVRVVALLASAVFVLGIFGPSMISARSTFAVWIGIAVCVTFVIVAWRLARPIYEMLVQSDGVDNNNEEGET